jgi:hypothetical protein
MRFLGDVFMLSAARTFYELRFAGSLLVEWITRSFRDVAWAC